MEYSIISSDLKSSDIKPEQSIQTYMSLLEKDLNTFFESANFVTSLCPSCNSKKTSETFKKLNYEYAHCQDCWTIYATKRPTQSAINRFYKESQARVFWIDHIWKDSESSRIQKILNPTIEWIKSFVRDEDVLIAEVLPHNPGFSKTWNLENKNLTLIEPIFPQIENSQNSTTLITNKLFDALCFFETLDRVESPRSIMSWAREHLNKNGHCFITGILSTGLDTLILGAHARTLTPPDRLNCFSLEGICKLAEEFNFEVIECSTPGVLDLENIARALNEPSESTGVPHSRFFQYILNFRPESPLQENLQRFLQENQLSSRARIVLKKKD